jgi:small subunit ribosomal protein S1
MSELIKEQEDFLAGFNWHNFEEGIDAVDAKNLEEFEALVSKTFVATDLEECVDGVVVRITDRDVIVDINAKSDFVKRIPLQSQPESGRQSRSDD